MNKWMNEWNKYTNNEWMNGWMNEWNKYINKWKNEWMNEWNKWMKKHNHFLNKLLNIINT